MTRPERGPLGQDTFIVQGRYRDLATDRDALAAAHTAEAKKAEK